MKILVPGLILFTVWCIISVRWYVCGIYELCDPVEEIEAPENTSEVAVDDVLSEPKRAPLSFEWSQARPVTTGGFADFKDSLTTVFDQDPAAVVEITGLYDPQEINNSDYENLGLARAENIKQLLLVSGIKRSIRVKSRTGDLSSGLRGNIIDAFEFKLVPQEGVTTGFIINEASSGLVIHYPTNGASPADDQQVQNALKKLARDAIKNGRGLLIVGHTDNRGDAMDNMKLGLVRATGIKDMLLSYGMQEKKVLAESEGERVPLVSNSSLRGRQQNRRVEIILI
jgi:OOP family OmpA-OmpF porin